MNENKKYRHFACGMFTATDGEEYEINIPSPELYNSEREAMQAGDFGYRFVLLDNSNEPEIVIMEKETFKVIETDNDHEPQVLHWLSGNVVDIYDFEKFKKLGGYIRMLRPECKDLGAINCETDFIDTDKTFADVFPNMQKRKMYYIDREGYYIENL